MNIAPLTKPATSYPPLPMLMLWVSYAIAKDSIYLSILSIDFPAIFPWTSPGLISIGYIGFPYNKLQTSISPEPLGPQRPNLAWKYI